MALINDPSDCESQFRKGQTTDAALINARFNTLYNEINGLLSDANFALNAAISESKLALTVSTADLFQRLGARGNRHRLIKRQHIGLQTLEINMPIMYSFIAPNSPNEWGLAFDDDRGVLWSSDDTAEEIYQVNTLTGAILSSFDTTGIAPRGMTYDGTNIWVVGNTTKEVYRYNTLGTILSSFDIPTGADRPQSISYLNGNLYYVDDLRKDVFRLNTLGTISYRFLAPIPTTGDFPSTAYPTGIANDGLNLYLADNGANLVWKLNTLGTLMSSFNVPTAIEISSSTVRDITYDGSHLWYVETDTDRFYKCGLLGWKRPPYYIMWYGDGVQDVITDREGTNNIAWWMNQLPDNNGAGVDVTVSSFVFDVPNSIRNDIAFKRSGTTRSVDDFYYMVGETADRVLRYRRGTFVSSFSLSGVNSNWGCCFGDNYLWILNRVSAGGTNIIYQVESSVYDTDSLTRAALNSFSVAAAASFSDTASGICYDDTTQWNRHSLWICESGANTFARISTGGTFSIYNSFIAPAGLVTPRNFIVLGMDVWAIENGAADDQIWYMNTLGTVLSSLHFPRSGGTGNTDFQGIDFDEANIWVSGNYDEAGAANDLVWMTGLIKIHFFQDID